MINMDEFMNNNVIKSISIALFSIVKDSLWLFLCTRGFYNINL